MKILILLAALTSLASPQCSKTTVKVLPACVQQKINAIKQQPKWNPPAQVNEYVYSDQTVYLFSADCCDRYTTAYDGNCKEVCSPSGGITGRGDGKCADFNDVAKHVRLVWKDGR